jgi:hypothetical protein
MTYTPRDAILHICRGYGIPLTEDEVTALVTESLDAIEAKGMAVREAAKAYEDFVVSLAADMVSRRSPEREVHMQSESPIRSN